MCLDIAVLLCNNCIKVSVKKDFLLLTDVPNIVLLDVKTYALTYSELVTSELSMTSNNNEAYILCSFS